LPEAIYKTPNNTSQLSLKTETSFPARTILLCKNNIIALFG